MTKYLNIPILRNVLALFAGAFFIVFLMLGSHALFAENLLKPSPVTISPFEATEQYPGGKATSRKASNSRNAFTHSSGNLDFDRQLYFKVGNALFKKLWVSSPASTKSSDGLGPLFNARSCQRCHLKDGRGHTPAANWPEDNQVSMFLRLSVPPETAKEKALIASGRASVIAEPTYGTQLQDLGIQGHGGEGRMHITYTPYPVKFEDGTEVVLRRPSYKITDLAYGPLAKNIMFSPRLTPQMIGLGLLEAIPMQDILAGVDETDENGDGISGRANWVWSLETDKLMLGRFGWKASMPTLRQQTVSAFSGDLGLSSSLMPGPSGDCTSAQDFCLNAPNGASNGKPEITEQMLDLVVFYTQNLAVPKRRLAKSEIVLKGKTLFHETGCASCHKPKFVTGKLPNNAHLEGQTIWPYTDMLLHDMGDGLADNRPEAKANGAEWRTAPLWGIGLTNKVSGTEYFLHDGRARSILEAILWHGGEATQVVERFKRLSAEERKWLIKFVRSL